MANPTSPSPAPQPAPLCPGQRAAKPAKAKLLSQRQREAKPKAPDFRKQMWAVVPVYSGGSYGWYECQIHAWAPRLFDTRREAYEQAQAMNGWAGMEQCQYRHHPIRVTVTVTPAGRAALRAGSRGGGRGRAR